MGRVRYKQCGQQFALNVAYKVLYNAAYPTRVVQCPIWIVQRGFWRQQPAQYLYLGFPSCSYQQIPYFEQFTLVLKIFYARHVQSNLLWVFSVTGALPFL